MSFWDNSDDHPAIQMPALQTSPQRSQQIVQHSSPVLRQQTRRTVPVMADDQQLQRRIADCDLQARAAAEQGDISGAAKLILTSLDCERRLAGRSPQVLQLIKPRT